MGLFDNIFKKQEVSTTQIVNEEKPNTSSLISKINTQAHLQIKKTMKDWEYAMYSATNPENINKTYIQNFYRDLMNDSVISSCINKRIERLIQSPFKIEVNGEESDKYYELFHSEWFSTITENYQLATFLGFSVLELLKIDENNIPENLVVIPRQNCIPELKRVRISQYDSNSISYANNKFIFQIYKDALGELNSLVPLYVYKKEALKAHAIFSEKFGNPLLIGKTPNKEIGYRERLGKFLTNLGMSGTAVIQMDDIIEIVETSNTDAYQVWKSIIDIINDEIAIKILGATMLTKDGSSNAQSQVHQDELKIRVKSDVRKFEYYINNVLIKQLKSLGVINQNDNVKVYYDLTERVDLTQRMEMDKALLQYGVLLNKDYLESTYDTKIDEMNKPKNNKQI